MLIPKIFAQGKEVTLPPIEGPGPLGKFLEAIKAGQNLGFIIGNVFKVVLIAAGLWTFYQFLMGGFGWISSGGDAKQVEAARNKLTFALVGLLIVAASWALIALAEQMFGICFGFTCEIDLENFANPNL